LIHLCGIIGVDGIGWEAGGGRGRSTTTGDMATNRKNTMNGFSRGCPYIWKNMTVRSGVWGNMDGRETFQAHGKSEKTPLCIHGEAKGRGKGGKIKIRHTGAGKGGSLLNTPWKGGEREKKKLRQHAHRVDGKKTSPTTKVKKKKKPLKEGL